MFLRTLPNSAPIVLTVARDEWRKSKSTRLEVAKASAIANDKDVILARLDDLPAWVSKNINQDTTIFVPDFMQYPHSQSMNLV